MIFHRRRRGRYIYYRGGDDGTVAAESRASNYECSAERTGGKKNVPAREEDTVFRGGRVEGGGKEKRRGFRAFVMENGGKY